MQVKNKINFILALLFAGIATHAQSPHAAQLYGMTQYGGPDHKGSVFHFTPATHAVTTDYDFQVKVKGEIPKCDIVTGNNGKYYGTTTAGGAYGAGVIFEWDSATSTYTELHDFTGADGSDARGGMVLYNGKFYGMTSTGGVNNSGVIYEWDFTANIYTVKIELDSINGKNPGGSLTLAGNKFYGFTQNGGANDCGVLFEWNPATNIYTKDYDFDSINGSYPVGKLIEYNGKLYAMTNTGGANNFGVIYEWNYSANVYTKKYDFNGIDGQYPLGCLALYNNKFYGLTHEGGIYETASPYDHFGVLFEWNPATNVYIKKKDMGNAVNTITHGSLGSLTLKGNVFYGTTSDGPFSGAIFSWDPATNIFTDNYLNHPTPFTNRGDCDEFRNAPGLNSYGNLFLSGDKLLGSYASGGGDKAGCIFEYYPDSNQITRAVHMLAADGKFPRGSLSRFGNKLFGLTAYGGNNHGGNIFEWDLNTQQFTERLQFDGYNTSIAPEGSLTLLDGKFYGINTFGKSVTGGIWSSYQTRAYTEFFSWNPVTDNYQSLYNLPDGTSYPASFTTFNNKLIVPLSKTVLVTPPNTYSYLAITKFDPATNTINDSTLIIGGGAFQEWQDNISGNGLTYYNGKYYGMTPANWDSALGFVLKGSIYEWDTTLTTGIHRLNLVDSIAGTYPTGDLVLADSVFYGLTTGSSSGGIYQNGGLFRWNPVTNVSELLLNVGGFGTPTYSGGKIYYLVGNLAPAVVEYDIALDTAYYYYLPTYPGSGQPYSWFNWLCNDNSYQKLLEVIPNQIPLLSNTPATQTVCSNQISYITFTLSDADNDTMSFQIASSDTNLISLQNISISNVDSNYTISYSNTNNQPGSDTIFIIANDGYGGSASFYFVVIVNALPNTGIAQTLTTLTAQQNGAGYQWIDCTSNTAITGETNQSYTAAINGSYAVAVTTNNCTDTSACVAVTTVDVEETVFSNNIIVKPNPAHYEIQISILENAGTKINSITIKNIIGEILIEYKQINKPINISALSNGVYFINVETGSGFYRTKFIKQ